MAHQSHDQSNVDRFSATIAPNGWTVGILLFSLATMLAGVERVQADNSPVPQLAEWESNMVSYGRQHCNELQPGEHRTTTNASTPTMMRKRCITRS